MSYQYQSITVSKLSIIGAGQIGPDIALHFSKVFARHDVEIVIVDISADALKNAQAKIERKIAKGEESGAFKPAMATAMKDCISYTTDYQNIAGSDIVLEAATEDEKIKDLIFKQVESICSDKCLFFSNSSHMQPEVIFKNIKDQSRTTVIHYFFPAERNPVVEIIPSYKTDKKLVKDLLGFYESIGKVPIKVRSSYGYAVDPIFEGLCQLAITCLERGYGTVKEIDMAAMKTLGLGVGPFTALNLTGGNPITDHGLDVMHDLLLPWFKSPNSLSESVKSGEKWDTAARGEKVNVDPDKMAKLHKQFLGGYFALAGFVMDLDICDISDLDMACEISLVVKPPFSLMNKIGLDKALRLTEEFCADHDGIEVPNSLKAAAEAGSWDVSSITKEIVGNVAVLTIRRPRVLNALNVDVMNDLLKQFESIEKNGNLIGTVLTGFGTKAFVSGADIRVLAACRNAKDGYEVSQSFHQVLNKIERLKKPTICAYNGFAFGGGNELAMACTMRVCKAGLKVAVCQPEVNLGIIPGAGGTQRLPRLIGLEKAAELLRTGRPISSSEAVELGLVYREFEGDLKSEAVALIKKVVNGSIQVSPIRHAALENVGMPAELELGHLSRKIDEILCKAIYEGAGMTLTDGLEMESKLSGECVTTEDMRIGVESFMTKGPRVKAEFVHR